MILYALQCGEGHRFEGWFADSASYQRQAAAGQVLCAVCGTPDIRKSMMTPALGTGAKAGGGAPEPRAGATEKKADAPDTLPSTPPSTPRARALAALRRHFEREADYVGRDFPREARRIRLGEARARLIYGQATRDEVEALNGEGIAVSPLPFTIRQDN